MIDPQPPSDGLSASIRLVHVIANPASGQDRPVLKVLNSVFQANDIDWEFLVTKKAGDARRLAQQAVEAGADIVAVYGGDGTVMEVASALVGKNVPLCIIPGGTANIMAVELGIPFDAAAAAALAGGVGAKIRQIDVGQAGNDIFLTRLGFGLEATMAAKTARDLKDRLGWLAYLISALQEMRDPSVAKYRLTLDGQQVEIDGLICIVANTGVIAPSSLVSGTGIAYDPEISVSDGLLDVLVVQPGDWLSMLSVAARMLAGGGEHEAVRRWPAREVTVEADPPQVIQCDGEMVGHTPISARVLPGALRVVVPQQPEATPPAPTEATAAAEISKLSGQPALPEPESQAGARRATRPASRKKPAPVAGKPKRAKLPAKKKKPAARRAKPEAR